MSFVTAAIGLGSAIGGKLLGGSDSSGGGSAMMPGGPISTDVTTTLGDVRFGDKYIGADSVARAADITDAKAAGLDRWLPWIVGGVVTLVLGFVFLLTRKK